ncbi:MAG: AraC family transcriptional regulator [Bacteroidales bacterium]|nr:AraC family transcriptional regulator [Bacteroidales bacterium]
MAHTGFSFYRPCRRLAPYVRHYWVLKEEQTMNALTFPVGCPMLLFHRKSPCYIPELNRFQDRLTVSGQVNFPAHLHSKGDLEMIAVVFRPHAIGLFLGMPASLLYNLEVSGHDIGNKDLEELAEKVFLCADERGCISIIEHWLLSQAAADLPDRGITALNLRRTEAAINAILANPSASVTDLSSAACLCNKQFGRIFNDLVGMNPKEYAQIVRFHKALSIMQDGAGGNGEWGDMAYRCGYSDQSHFIREFKRFSGYTPASFPHTEASCTDLFTEPA